MTTTLRGTAAVAALLAATGCGVAPPAPATGPASGPAAASASAAPSAQPATKLSSTPQPVRVSRIPNVAHLAATSPLRSGTLAPGDAWLRHYFMEAKRDSLATAFDEKSKIRPKDDLQRSLQLALVLHQNGDYEGSNRIFEEAEAEAEARYAKSVTQMGLSMAMNDTKMDYVPSRAEISMIPYYRMNNYLRLGNIEAALIEARKANAYMARIDGSTGDICRSSIFLKYMTGLVYEMGGEHNDAVVSMRQADAGYRQCAGTYGFQVPASFGADLHRVATRAGLGDVASDAAKRYGVSTRPAAKGTGEVALLLENGFVIHRSEQSVHLPIPDSDAAGLSNPVTAAATAALITSRVVTSLTEQGAWGTGYDDRDVIELWEGDFDAYVMKLAWPAYRLEPNRVPSIRVVAGSVAAEAGVVQDLSGEVVRDFEGQRKKIVARSLARGGLKYAASRGAEKLAGNAGMFAPIAKFVAKKAVNAAANAMEDADTRSWSLLPDQLAMARVRLPAGEHLLTLEMRDEQGAVVGTREVPVTVEAGKLAVVNQRVWGNGDGDTKRLATAVSGIHYEEVSDDPNAAPSAAPAQLASAQAPSGATPAAPSEADAVAEAAYKAARQQGMSEEDSRILAAAMKATKEQRLASQGQPQGTAAAPATVAAQAAPTAAPAEAAAAPVLAPKAHAIGVTVSPLGGSAEYMVSRGGSGMGIAFGVMMDEYGDEEFTTLAARFRVSGRSAGRGIGLTSSIGAASLCDMQCWGSGADPLLGLLTGIELGYVLKLGPLGVGVVGGGDLITILTVRETDGYSDDPYGYSSEPEEMYILPTFGVKLGLRIF